MLPSTAAPAGPPPPDAEAAGGPPRAVIDTNVWLDLYLYDDAHARPLARALAEGTLRALRTSATDAELRVVLARPVFAARLHGRAAGAGLAPERLAQDLIEAWQRQARLMAPPCPSPLSCRDPDDQKFLDLACASGAAWLFTKDRALLSLAAKARRAGLAIVTPAAYRPDAAHSDIGYR